MTRKSVKFRAKTQRCSVCSNYQLAVGVNDLLTVAPEVATEIDKNIHPEFDPRDYSAFSEKKLWWICRIGHSYEMSIRTRTQQRSGCTYCAGKKVLVGFNDLQSRNPELLKLWNFQKNSEISPNQVTTFSGKRVWWNCEKGHEWQSIISNIAKGSGCPRCAPGGFDQSKPGIIYYIQSKELNASKIGITNQGIKTLRLKYFESQGWRVIQTFDIQSGSQTRKIETLMLNWLRKDQGLPPYLSKTELAGGWKETFSLEALTDKQVIDRVTQLIQETNGI
jgi:hypothetical protein